MIAALPVSLLAEPRALLAAQAALSGDSTAIADFSSLPTTEARQETLRAIFNDRQGEYDAVRRAAFVQQLPPEQRMEALSAMVITPADCPALLPVVDQAVRSGTGGSSLNSAVVTIAAQNPDPAAAMQWLDTLPAGEARDSGRSGIFSNFALKDAVAASAWLAALPPETPRRDEMTSTLVSRITPSDPERAWQWAATILDETKRQSVQQSVLERWHLLDPAAAARAAGQ